VGKRRFPPDPWLTLSLLIATLLAAWPQPHDGTLAFLVLFGTTLLSLRFRLSWIALIVLFVVAIELRYAQFGVGISDVATVIRAALDQLAHGGNPYTALASDGAPFPYGPLALLWYMPMHDPRFQEFCVSLVLTALLAFRGEPLGLALWATAPVTVNLASDGSNDHTAALLLLVALIVLERAPRAGALLVGVAASFKIYALAWLPPIFFWAGAGAFAAGLAGAALLWVPAAILWGVPTILSAYQAAETIHKTPYYSLADAVSRTRLQVTESTFDIFRLIAGAATAIVLSPFVRTHRGVVIVGIAIYFVTLYAGFWSTPAYLIPIALVVCWYIDATLGPPLTRIRWPSDPFGLILETMDRRWPKVDAARIAAP
jgi:hypothetical protein